MLFQVVYKPLAQIEASEAYQWYEQPHIGMGNAFLDELERTNGFIARANKESEQRQRTKGPNKGARLKFRSATALLLHPILPTAFEDDHAV